MTVLVVAVCILVFQGYLTEGFTGIRLVDQRTGKPVGHYKGIVQIYINETWYYLSGYGFNGAKTRATCKQLDFKRQPLNYWIPGNLTKVDGNVIRLENLDCRSTGVKLLDCSYTSWHLVEDKNIMILTLVDCGGPLEQCEAIDIRLQNGSNVNVGSLQIKQRSGGEWKTLYAKHFDNYCAKQACIQLGFPGGIKQLLSREYFSNKGRMNYECRGTQKGLNCCSLSKKYRHTQNTMILCQQDIQLSGTNKSTLTIYRQGRWYHVCGEHWTGSNTKAVCAQLGYKKNRFRHYFGPVVSNMIWENDITCSSGDVFKNCMHTPRMGKICEKIVYIDCGEKNIRVTGFNVEHAGRIEVLNQGVWGRVIQSDVGAMFGYNESMVACREMGYSGIQRVLSGHDIPQIKSPLHQTVIWLYEVTCQGHEPSLFECSHKLFRLGYRDASVGVLCKHNLRLTHSLLPDEGIVQTFQENRWKLVCEESLSSNAPDVICLTLGYSKVVHIKKQKHFNTANTVGHTRVECDSSARDLSDCVLKAIYKDNCDAFLYVKCQGNERDLRFQQFRFENGLDVTNLLQITHEGILGFVSTIDWKEENAKVACRQLNSPSLSSFQLANSSVIYRDSVIWLYDVHCNGNEKNLLECTTKPWEAGKLRNNTHEKIAKFTCSKRIRLSGSDRGFFEEYIEGKWRQVCSNDHRPVADFCKMLDFVGGKKLPSMNVTSNNCVNQKLLFGQCFSGKYRFVENRGLSYKGIIEILENREWNKIHPVPLCNYKKDRFGFFRNVCRELGYPEEDYCYYKTMDVPSLFLRYDINSGKLRSLQTTKICAGVKCAKALRLLPSNATKPHIGMLQIYWRSAWRAFISEIWSEPLLSLICNYLGYSGVADYVIVTIHEIQNQTRVILNFTHCERLDQLTECLFEENLGVSNIMWINNTVNLHCNEPGKDLSKVCTFNNSEVSCVGKKLDVIPWVPPQFQGEDVRSYLLSTNNIKNVRNFQLQNFIYLERLDLSSNKLELLPDNLFRYTTGLVYLNLSGNNIIEIKYKLLKDLTSLTTLDISNNPRIEVFDIESLLHKLHNLKHLVTDNFVHCCYVHSKNPNIRCTAPENYFSDCEKLLKNDFLGGFIWVVAALVFFGNAAAIFVRITLKERGVQSILIGSLFLSDSLMFVYLIIIAYNNVFYKGEYFKYDSEWRTSLGCTIAGVVSSLSSQVSLFLITAITTERCYKVVYALKEGGRFQKTKKVALATSLWSVGGILAILPALSHGYFNEPSIKFYGQNSVCLPLQIPGQGIIVLGWEYCFALFGVLNTVLCIYIAFCYLAIHISLKKKYFYSNSVQEREDSHLSKRMFWIVFTNLACWIPVTIFMYSALHGLGSHVKKIHSWTAVCLFPINAALNPAIYTLFAPSIRERVSNAMNSITTRLQSTEV